MNHGANVFVAADAFQDMFIEESVSSITDVTSVSHQEPIDSISWLSLE